MNRNARPKANSNFKNVLNVVNLFIKSFTIGQNLGAVAYLVVLLQKHKLQKNIKDARGLLPPTVIHLFLQL